MRSGQEEHLTDFEIFQDAQVSINPYSGNTKSGINMIPQSLSKEKDSCTSQVSSAFIQIPLVKIVLKLFHLSNLTEAHGLKL
jgi:hypothetical protein